MKSIFCPGSCKIWCCGSGVGSRWGRSSLNSGAGIEARIKLEIGTPVPSVRAPSRDREVLDAAGSLLFSDRSLVRLLISRDSLLHPFDALASIRKRQPSCTCTKKPIYILIGMRGVTRKEFLFERGCALLSCWCQAEIRL